MMFLLGVSKMKILLGISVMILSSCAIYNGNPEHSPKTSPIIEHWNCYDSYKGILGGILIEVKRIKSSQFREVGEVKTSGITRKTSFRISGIDRRWDWELDKDGAYNYSFVIGPRNKGRYYDFTFKKSAKPREIFDCVRFE